MVFFPGDLKRGDFPNLEVSETTKRCHGRPAGGDEREGPRLDLCTLPSFSRENTTATDVRPAHRDSR